MANSLIGLRSLVLALSAALVASSQRAFGQQPSSLGELGITPSAVYDGAAFGNLAGGVRRSAVYSGNLALRLTLDLERLMRWQGATFYAGGVWIHGGQPSRLAGDAQGVSNISAPAAAELEELWLQQNLAGVSFSALAGLFDPSREFYRLQSAGLFLNSSFGTGPEFSQTGSAGPGVFPNTSLGVRLAYKPDRRLLLRAALLDGAPLRGPDGALAAFRASDGGLFLSEVALLVRPKTDRTQSNQRFRLGRFSNLPPYDHKLAFGAWHYTATFNDLGELQPNGPPARPRGSSGAYLIADVLLASGGASVDERQSAFIQLGVSDARSSRFATYVGAGLVASGVAGKSVSDELGFAIAVARNGSHYLEAQRAKAVPVRRAELDLESSYLVQLTPFLAVQPDLQYVLNPDTDPEIGHALAATLRFEVGLPQ